MALNVDLSRPARSPSELRAIGQAVRDAPVTEQETDWIEWKTNVDLSNGYWQGTIGRHILGFANRDPSRASKFAGGCAYLLLGVEPQGVDGIVPADSADLESWVDRYLGSSGPQWSPHYIEIDGKSVLVIVVEAPEWGDPIFVLRKAFDKYPEGRVFIRRLGKTVEADASEMDMLQERARVGAAVLNLEMHWVEEPQLIAIDFSPGSQEKWLESHRKAVASSTVVPPSLEELLSALVGKRRPDEQFSHELDDYMSEAAATLMARIQSEAVLKKVGELRAAVSNPTEHNFPDVLVEFDVEGNISAFFEAEEAEPEGGFHSPPRKFSGGLAQLPSGLHVPSPSDLLPRHRPQGITQNDGGTRIVFRPPVHLRPRYDVDLDPVFLVIGVEHGGKTLGVEWTATSTSFSGVVRGSLEATVSDKVVALSELLGA